MTNKRTIFGRLWAWLTSSQRSRSSKKHPDLYELSDTEIAEELDLKAVAARLGSAGLPAPDATELSGVEHQITHRIERARLDYIDWANMRLSVLNQDLRAMDVTPLVNRALQADREFSRQASALLEERGPMLQALAAAAEKRKQELLQFKAENGLARDAHYPVGAKRFFLLAVFAALVVFEAGINSFFFAQGLSTGLVGGFLMAGLFALLNVGAAGLQGRYCLPFSAHRVLWLRLAGIASWFVALLVVTAVSLAIAHYRDALMSDAENAAKVALATLKG